MTFTFRLYSTLAITSLIWLLLLWNHFNGGVPSHHILANNDLPSISNWWGGILLPTLTWFLLFRIDRRIRKESEKNSISSYHLRKSFYGFAGSLLFGILLSLFFTLGYSDICGYLVLTLLPISFFIPIYRSEYLLGFVIGMTFTFGAVLPTAIGLIFMLIGAVLYLGLQAVTKYYKSRYVSNPAINR